MKVKAPEKFQYARLLISFCEEPYRCFFPLGILIGMAGVGHWLGFAAGWFKTYSTFFHSSIQMHAYMSCFVLGFLLTAVPRLTSASHATPMEFGAFLILVLGMPIFLESKNWIWAELCYGGLLLGLARFVIQRIKNRNPSVTPPNEFLWIPVGIFLGVFGISLMILVELRMIPAWLMAVGKPMEEQGFLLAVVLGVGGFLAPRLMGRYPAREPLSEPDSKKRLAIRQGRIFRHIALGLLLFASFWFEGLGSVPSSYALRAFIVTISLAGTHALPLPPRGPYMHVRLLWVSLWMIVGGLWSIAFFPGYRTALLHFVLIGGFSLMTFAVGTMVVVSHAGEGERLNHPLPVLWVVTGGIALALVLRVTAAFIPLLYFQLLGAAASVWILSAASWLVFVMPRVLRIPSVGEFERCHEEAKKRIADLQRSSSGGDS